MSTPHQTFRKGIFDYFNADQSSGTVYDAVSGRLYGVSAPEDPTFPYLSLMSVSMVEWDTFNLTGQAGRYQFTAISDNAHDESEILDIMDKLRTRFDHASLTLSGSGLTTFTIVDFDPAGDSGPEIIEDRMAATQDYILTAHQ